MAVNVVCSADQFTKFVKILSNRNYLLYELAQGDQGQMIINVHWNQKTDDGMNLIKNIIRCEQDSEVHYAWEVTTDFTNARNKMLSNKDINIVTKIALKMEDALNSSTEEQKEESAEESYA